jgi:hypothetical protein
LEPSLPKAHRATAYRIMHGALAVNACAMSHGRHKGDCDLSHACCAAAGCTHSRRIETLSHAFLDCPSVRPALLWLLDVWHAASAIRLPPDAAVILADDTKAWPGGAPPAADTYQLWTRLRLAYLHAAWQARCSLAADEPSAHAAALAMDVIDITRRHISGDWLRATVDIRTATALSSSWFRGRKPELTVEVFAQRWALRGVLCEVQGDDLHLHLSNSRPIAIPPSQAAPQSALPAAGSPGSPPAPQ